MRISTAAAISLLGMAFAGCTDESTSTTPTPSPTTTTTAPAGADIELTVETHRAVAADSGNLFVLDIRLTERGGVGANIDFARLEIFRATGELEERLEIGADEIVRLLGDNRLEANRTESATLQFPFRSTPKEGRELLLTMGLTDDAGNELMVSHRFVFDR